MTVPHQDQGRLRRTSPPFAFFCPKHPKIYPPGGFVSLLPSEGEGLGAKPEDPGRPSIGFGENNSLTGRNGEAENVKVEVVRASPDPLSTLSQMRGWDARTKSTSPLLHAAVFL